MKNWLDRYKNILIAIILTIALMTTLSGALWAMYINPKIDARVRLVTDPLSDEMSQIKEELILINCQFSVTLPDSLRKEALNLFDKARRLGSR